MQKSYDFWRRYVYVNFESEETLSAIFDYDFSKHAPLSDVPKIRWIWDSVPVQLAKENNKFVFSHVKKGKRSAELIVICPMMIFRKSSR